MGLPRIHEGVIPVAPPNMHRARRDLLTTTGCGGRSSCHTYETCRCRITIVTELAMSAIGTPLSPYPPGGTASRTVRS